MVMDHLNHRRLTSPVSVFLQVQLLPCRDKCCRRISSGTCLCRPFQAPSPISQSKHMGIRGDQQMEKFCKLLFLPIFDPKDGDIL